MSVKTQVMINHETVNFKLSEEHIAHEEPFRILTIGKLGVDIFLTTEQCEQLMRTIKNQFEKEEEEETEAAFVSWFMGEITDEQRKEIDKKITA